MNIQLGISTCPNDTFAFHGLLTGAVDLRGITYDVQLLDVEALNRRLLEGELDVAKASFHAALLMAAEVAVLPAGSAIGFGVGPLLLAARAGTHPRGQPTSRVLCPGEHTTAALLYRLFHPGEGRVEHAVFSDIMPALQVGDADFGVCIHEGRFTYREQGLSRLEDLGETWERDTGAPLPLGGIVGRQQLGDEVLRRVGGTIRDSLAYGLAHREEALLTMRRHAQELDDEVIWKHVELYVNDWTLDLGDVGRAALSSLSERAAAAGLIPAARSLRVIDP